jgi:hypothetical protein
VNVGHSRSSKPQTHCGPGLLLHTARWARYIVARINQELETWSPEAGENVSL